MKNKSVYIFIGILFVILIISLVWLGVKLTKPKTTTKEPAFIKDEEVQKENPETGKITEYKTVEDEVKDKIETIKDDEEGIEYNKKDLESFTYSDKNKDVMPDEELKSIDEIIRVNMATLDATKTIEDITNLTKRYNSRDNEKFYNEYSPMLMDLSLIAEMNYVLGGDDFHLKSTLNEMESDLMYVYSLLSIPEKRLAFITEDENSIITLTGKEELLNEKTLVYVDEIKPISIEDSPYKLRGVDGEYMEAKIKIGDKYFKAVFIKNEKSRLFAGFYDYDKNDPSMYTKVGDAKKFFQEMDKNSKEAVSSKRDEDELYYYEDPEYVNPRESQMDDYYKEQEEEIKKIEENE